jgi:phage terminase large subunit-like protein
VHSEGDYLGQPFGLRPWQKRFIWRAYELLPDGSRRYDRALLGLPKGNGKTEIAAAIAIVELAGPVVFDGWKSPGVPNPPVPRTSADVPIAAASFEQANTLFSACKAMISNGPLADLFECFETEIMPKVGSGSLYRVAAVAGTNDGRRPTFFVADELHEWDGRKERVHLVLSNGRAKRADAWELAISTAGWDMASLLAQKYELGKSGTDPRFLFEWWEAAEDWAGADENPTDEQIEVAVRAASPAAGDFLPLENIVRRYHELGPAKRHEFERYYLNRWASAPEKWLPSGLWAACRDVSRVKPPKGARIAIGFDGSYSRDSTGLVGCTLEVTPYLFVIGTWERPEKATEDWRVPIQDVEQEIATSCDYWDVASVGCDPFRWQRSIEVLLEAGLPMVEWASHSAARMAPACAKFEDAVQGRAFTHDGHAALERHIENCVIKIDSRGKRITKVHKDSERRIDLAVCAVIAYDMALRALNMPRPSWRPL